MKLSTDATPPGDRESIAWHHAQLGELYRQLGRPEEAAFEFAWADQSFPGHPFAAVGIARIKEATATGPARSARTRRSCRRRRHLMSPRGWAICTERWADPQMPSGSTRWRKRDGGLTRLNQRFWRAFWRSTIVVRTRPCAWLRLLRGIDTISSPTMRWRGRTSKPVVSRTRRPPCAARCGPVPKIKQSAPTRPRSSARWDLQSFLIRAAPTRILRFQ